MSRHAAPWSLWAMYRDSSERTQPGRHARNVSSTQRLMIPSSHQLIESRTYQSTGSIPHVPAWPFNRRKP